MDNLEEDHVSLEIKSIIENTRNNEALSEKTKNVLIEIYEKLYEKVLDMNNRSKYANEYTKNEIIEERNNIIKQLENWLKNNK